MYQSFGKRALDISLAIFGLIFLSPILLLLAIVVRLKLGSPILFNQLRPGKHGQPFCNHKYRSMTNERDDLGNRLPNVQRLTRFGRILRDTSLDELPELVNVLKGEMSLIGPRPLRMRYLDRYSPEQMRRHEVKPGITGWAQVNGRNSLSWERKFELDVWYVDNHSLMLDIKILIMTIRSILRKEGINQSTNVSMEEFMGGHH